MTGLALAFGLAVAGAFIWRLRGADDLALPGRKTLAALAIGGAAGLVTGYAWLGLLVALPARLAVAIGHGVHMDMGRMPQTARGAGESCDHRPFTFWLPDYAAEDPLWRRRAIDIAGMSVIGAIRHLLIALPLIPFGPVAALVYAGLGLLHGPAYALALSLPEIRARAPLALRPDHTLGEVLAGAILFGGLALWR